MASSWELLQKRPSDRSLRGPGCRQRRRALTGETAAPLDQTHQTGRTLLLVELAKDRLAPGAAHALS